MGLRTGGNAVLAGEVGTGRVLVGPAGDERRRALDGRRNFTARNNLKAMKKGDRAFFYHSNQGKEIVGVVEVVREAYPDATAKKATGCAST